MKWVGRRGGDENKAKAVRAIAWEFKDGDGDEGVMRGVRGGLEIGIDRHDPDGGLGNEVLLTGQVQGTRFIWPRPMGGWPVGADP